MDSILNPPSPDSNPSTQFERDRHVRFLEIIYQLLPSEYQGQEINRLTLAYFVVSGLHILSASDRARVKQFFFTLFQRQAIDGRFQGRLNKDPDTCYAFCKFPRQLPYLYHSYYRFSAFSLLEEPGVNPICVELGITDVDAIGI